MAYTNTSRKRTQRSFALESAIIQDVSHGNKYQRKRDKKAAALRFARLGSLASIERNQPRGSASKAIWHTIAKTFDATPKAPHLLLSGLTRHDTRLFNSTIQEQRPCELGLYVGENRREETRLHYGKTSVSLDTPCQR